MTTSLTAQDTEFLQSRNISSEQLQSYKEVLINGYPFISLTANCQPGKEINIFDEAEIARLRAVFQDEGPSKRIVKFVPASGAASRMFKDLFTFLETGKTNATIDKFFTDLPGYPFYTELMKDLDQNNPADVAGRQKIIDKLLSPAGLNYGELPKGLISFHKYPGGDVRTAFAEHFYEAKLYASSEGEAHIHFTIPENTQDAVQAHLKDLKTSLGKKLGIHFHIVTSIQKPSTDTPALYADDHSWVRDESGNFLLRPAGHGALIENLNDTAADIVFVKNIDNVVPDRLKDITVKYKEVLAGVLIEVQTELFRFLEQAEIDSVHRDDCEEFFQKWFLRSVRQLSDSELTDLMNRPIRVCGMVKNEGEPGGGPFLVKEKSDSPSLQIVETAQLDQTDQSQKEMLSQASHFNPVDLVVGLKNYKGEAFDLREYRNPETGMVVSKTYQGREIKALELPGLWNGSMHYWNTIFVEVPIETFNPVKTVFDLLRPQHQAK